MEEQVCLPRFHQGGVEGGNQAVGQLADESDRIGEQHIEGDVEAPVTGAGIESREETVFDEHIGSGESPEKCRLASIGVSHQRDAERAFPRLVLGVGLFFDLFQSSLEDADLLADDAAVRLQLGFTGSAGADRSTLHPGKVGPHPGQA